MSTIKLWCRNRFTPFPLGSNLVFLVVFGVFLMDTPRASAQRMSIDELRTLLDNNSISSATIITHGYQTSDGAGDALMPLAQAIADRNGGWLIDYDVVGGRSFIDTTQSMLPTGMNEQRHAVVLFDWARESDEAVEGWVEGAGDSVFNLMVNLGLVNPKAGTGKELHLIGHSFGTAATSETVERLARYNIAVDHVTYLDPHEFDQAALPDDPSMTTLGKPAGYGATVWNNVDFADAYYETRGTNANGRDSFVVPRGRPIPGAYNVYLNDGFELPDDRNGTAQQSPYTDLSGDHSYVWSGFYRGTVQNGLPTGSPAPETAVAWNTTGYNFSQVGMREDDLIVRPDPVFFGAVPDQDHTYSNRNYATAAGAAAMGVGNPAAFTTAKYAPDWNKYTIFNGNFEFDPQSSLNPFSDDDNTPGWDTHSDNGGGAAETAAIGGNTFLVLTEATGRNSPSRTHDRMYVPHDVRRLLFDMAIPTAGMNDALNVLFDGKSLGTFSTMVVAANFATFSVPLTRNLRNDVKELMFRLDLVAGMGTPVVRIDNVRYSLVPEPACLVLLFSALGVFRRRI